MLRLYIDDSGNTGAHLLDHAQPFGVTALVLVTAAQQAAIRSRVATLLGEVRQPPKELKFAHLAKRVEGRKLIAGAMDLIGDIGANVFFGLTEKPYLAAALFAETFLDPLVNNNVPPRFVRPEARIMAANLILSVTPSDVLIGAARAWRHRERGALIEGAIRVASLLRFHPADDAQELADVLAAAASDPFLLPTDHTVPHLLDRPTPHTFAFVTVLGMVDRRLRAQDQRAKAIADADVQFGPVVNFFFQFAQAEEHFPNPYSNLDGPIRNIVGLTEAESKQEIGVQLADLCAGLIASVAGAALEGRPVPPSWTALRRILKVTNDVGPASFWQVSERCLRTLAPTFEGLTPRPERAGWRW